MMDLYFDVMIAYLFRELSTGWGQIGGEDAFRIPRHAAVVEDWFNNLSL
jgi:hypothetical protein